MGDIIPVLIGAIITAVIGNKLVHVWQNRSWRDQQRQIGLKAELDEMKKLIEDISCRVSDRHNSMRHLISSLSPNSNIDTQQSLSSYQDQLRVWNSALPSFLIKLRLIVNYAEAIRFENEIHNVFYHAGAEIENIIRSRSQGIDISWRSLEAPKHKLNIVQRNFSVFLRELSDNIESRNREIFFGRKILYTDNSFDEYSILDLIKALFISRVDRFYIIRSS